MIKPMKHITILFTANQRRRTIIRLRELGVLHIQREHESAEVSSKIHTRFNVCRHALQIMRQYRKTSMERVRKSKKHQTRAREYGVFPGEKIAHAVVSAFQRLEGLREEEQRIAHYIKDLKVWGEFSRNTLEELQERNLYCHFYTLTKKLFAKTGPQGAMIVTKQRGKVYFVVISRTEENELPYEETSVPLYDLDQLFRRQTQIHAKQEELEGRLVRWAGLLRIVWTAYQRLSDLNQIINVRSAFEWQGEVMFVRGFVPTDHLAELKQQAKEMKWGLLVRDPNLQEEPPTILSNRRSIAIINPIYRMLGTLPGYREPEISALFLFFFVLFFAMIIGDAGYGLLLMSCALCYRLCAPRTEGHRQGSALLLVVGTATLVWGAVSGNWFSIEALATHPFFVRFTVARLNAFDTQSISFVQWICFLIATVHISIAHIWRTIHQWRHGYWLQACANIGWLFMVIGLYSLVVQLILGAFGYWYIGNILPLLIIGLCGIVLFEQQERGVSVFIGIVKGIAGLFNTLLNTISAFADIISYLRLFAVGLASVEIARSFNQLATSLEDGVVGTIIAIALLCLGHSLNLAMGALSIIVHGVRLNMLEFSSHLGIEWSGIVYQPFKRQMV